MGTDIHEHIEIKVNGKWERVPEELGPKHWLYGYEHCKEYNYNSWDIGRNYFLFAILAGVRGHATPIKSPVGIPKDVSKETLKSFYDWEGNAHTPSYYSLTELLEFANKKHIQKAFVIFSEYKKYKQSDNLPYYEIDECYMSYYKKISNEAMNKLLTLSPFLDNDRYYTELDLEYTSSHIDDHFFNKIVPAMQKLDENTDNVRIIFWFDN